jgi:hypothetical protein
VDQTAEDDERGETPLQRADRNGDELLSGRA